jgi:ATP-binding cassette, subfamily B, bacterial
VTVALQRWLVTSPRLRAMRLLWSAGRALSVFAVLFVLAEGALPVVVLIAMARVVAAIPGAVAFGISSSSGHQMLVALGEAGALYALSLMRGPFEDALTAAATARIDAVMQRRLVDAVCAPAGIEHLEDEGVLDRLSSARGELLNSQPAGAPMALISIAGDRLTGILACATLGVFRWWLGLGLFLVWIAVRRPLAALVRSRVATSRQAGVPLRRSWYLLGLAWKPPAAKEMRVFGLGDWITDRHREHWLEGMTPAWRTLRRLNTRVWIAGAVVLVAYAGATATLGWAAEHQEISLRTLVTMLPMLPSSMSVGSITYSNISLEAMLSSLPDLDSLTDQLSSASAPHGGELPASGLPHKVVRFERVSFGYPGAGRDVLHDLNLDLEIGQSLGLVGVNGAGKTTLVTLLARMREPTDGTITVDGISVGQLRPREWQRQVAVVYQDFTRFPMSAAANVGMFADGHPPDPDLLERAASRAGATAIIERLPHGWDTVLSPQYGGGVDLSGGGWQRIALARALYAVETGARVLVLDEPTAQLDVRGEAAFYDQFLELTAGVTSVVISHRFASVRRAHRIAVLDGGRISELGNHEQLLAAAGTYAEMFRAQAERFAESETHGGGES